MRRLGIVLAVIVLIGLPGRLARPAAAQTPEGLVAVIQSPVAGEQLFGLVTITGSAEHPEAFASYTLEYDSLNDPAEQWFLVQERVTQQVRDGVLGAWRTDLVPDGAYQLRLRVFLTDGQTGEFVVSNLQVANSAPTPLPNPAVAPQDAAAPAVTPGPSPTSPIEQPPSSNPLAGSSAGSLESANQGAAPSLTAGDSPSETSPRINLSRVRSAFCSGVYLTLVIFGLMLAYLLLRGRLRPYTRRIVWQSEDDLDHNHR